jgi:peptidoglycan/xylan/chitin deacetylase (PgdA/CDA1 family)
VLPRSPLAWTSPVPAVVTIDRGMQGNRAAGGVVALMYHGVGEPADPREGSRYTVTVAELEEQLAILVRHARLIDPRTRLARDGVALTFDDGEATVLTEALPRLERLGARAALFMTTGWIGRPGYLDEDGLRTLKGAGWLVGSHGHTHRFLTTLDASELDDELRRSRDILSAVLGEAPTDLAFPGGRTSPTVERAARNAGYTRFWSSSPGLNRELAPGASIRRTAIRRGEPAQRFERLVSADPVAHLADRVNVACKSAVRQALGDDRYHAFTGRLLASLGRR